MELKDHAKRILELADEIDKYRNLERQVASAITSLEIKYQNKSISEDDFRKSINRYLRGRTREEVMKDYERHIANLLGEIRIANSSMYKQFSTMEALRQDKVKMPMKVPSASKDVRTASLTDKQEIKKYLDDLEIKHTDVKGFVSRHKKKDAEGIVSREDYTVYSENKIGKIANTLFGGITNWFTSKYPELFKKLYDSLRVSDTRILSKTYVSITIMSSIIAMILFGIASLIFFEGNLFMIILRAVAVAILAGVVTFVSVYYYPISVIKSRSRRIKNELPFVAIHMSAVAGSGARPLTIFKLILESGEYKVISVEIKKILNYVNLFGYNLSTALKAVANTTPSYDFRELLNGMIAAIETGGDLKVYLKGKASEMLNTYRLDRRKYVDALAAYSDIYTGILIAAPLLFIVTLAIINVIGGDIAGISVDIIAKIGTYGLIPFMNVAFLLFLNIIQPKD